MNGDTEVTATVSPSDNTTYTFSMPAANVTVSAEFERKTVNVVFNAGTDATIDSAASKTYTINEGDALNTHADLSEAEAAIPTPVKNGYTFKGWHDDSDTENANSVATIDLTAAVNANASYTALYVENYGVFADGKIQAIGLHFANIDKTSAQLKLGSVNSSANSAYADSTYYANQGTYDSSRSAINGGNDLTVIKVDASSYDITRNRVNLVFHSYCTAAGSNSKINFYELKNDVADMAAATYTSLGLFSSSVQRVLVKGTPYETSSIDGSGSDITIDITPYLISDADNVLYFAFATATAREQSLSNFNLTTSALYKADITVTDGENTLAGAVIAMNGYDATGMPVTSITTNASGVASIYLPIGTHTVTSVEKIGYVAPATIDNIVITDADVTPTITMTPQSDPDYEVTLNTDPFASISVVAGTSDAGNDVAAQSVTADATGKATLTLPAGTYTYSITSVNSYKNDALNQSMTITSDNKTVTKALTYKNENMVYGQDFGGYSAETDISLWNTGGGNFRTSGFAVEESNTFLRGTVSTGKMVGHVIYNLDSAVSLENKKVTVEYDFRVPAHQSPLTGVVTFGDSLDKVAIAVAQNQNNNYTMGYYTGGEFDTAVGSGRWGVDENAGTITNIKDGSYNGTGWYHIKIEIVNRTASITVTDNSNTEDTTTISNVSISSTDITKIKLGIGKALGGSNLDNYSHNSGDLDNISIVSENIS